MSPLVRLISGSLLRRLALSIALVHAVMMAFFVFDLTAREQGLLRQQAQQELLDMVQVLAHASREWTLARDVVGLHELLEPIRGREGIEYAMILDRDGRVLAHAQTELVGRYLNDDLSLSAMHLAADAKAPPPRLLQDTSVLMDAIAPIRHGEQVVGWVRVAKNTTRTQAALTTAIKEGVLYALMAILIGTLLAILIARDLTHDLRRINALLARVGQGALNERIEVRRRDELGQVMHALNGMLARLELDDRQLKQTRERLELALRASNDGLWDWNLRDNTVYYSPRWKSMLGYAEDEIGTSPEEWSLRIHHDDRPMVELVLQEYLEGRTPDYECIIRMRHKDGGWRWILTRGLVLRDGQGVAMRMVGTHTDITRRIELEQSLQAQRERLRIVLMSMADGVIVTDAHDRVELINPAAERLTGRSLAEALGQPLERVARLEDDAGHAPLDIQTLHRRLREGHCECAARLLRHGAVQEVLELEIKISAIQHAAGMEGMVLLLHDVSAARRMLEQMSWQATHDPLTGLPNRTAFSERLKALLESARSGERRHALLYMDLDQFKVVNDTCGHQAGDELLMEIATLLREAVRKDDMIARLGGDEFAGLLPDCDLEGAEKVAQQLRERVRNFSFYWHERVFNVGVSIGIVAIDQEWDTADDILRAADIACYAAKEEGRNRLHIYQQADAAMAHRVEQLSMAAQIQIALREERFALYAQPLKPLDRARGDEGLHLEVLVRMLDREGHILTPERFIGAAERYNHMPSIDRWVIDATLTRLQSFMSRPDALKPAHVGINLSGTTLTDAGLLGFIEEEVRRHRFPAGLICFEITETAIISNMHQALAFMERMKALGCTFALDDFGSGLSSFAYLKALPVDFLKIDGVFVRDIESDPHDRSFVQAIHQVGRTLGLKTVAEFVENAATEQILREMGVDYAQGYGISPPRPLDDLLDECCTATQGGPAARL